MHDFCACELTDTETKDDRMQEVCQMLHYTLQNPDQILSLHTLDQTEQTTQ